MTSGSAARYLISDVKIKILLSMLYFSLFVNFFCIYMSRKKFMSFYNRLRIYDGLSPTYGSDSNIPRPSGPSIKGPN
jgi:hypothetical protein